MKKILLFPLSLLLLFICLSCTRDVILKLDPAPPVLVLNASVTHINIIINITQDVIFFIIISLILSETKICNTFCL